MSLGTRDTIAAIATPAGAGGIGVVRVSGPAAGEVLGRLLGRPAEAFPDRALCHGVARDRRGQRLDEVLAVLMRAPRSFTGEDVAELHGHGGAVNMTRLLRAALEAGARPAEGGEFTRRAFENGKLDLVRAEAILDVIEASSERAWRLAQAQLAGNLGTQVTSLRERATSLLAEVEACIDFPEEGEEFLGTQEMAVRAAALARDVSDLSGTYQIGRAVREGIDVAITGPVNSGKSSIFNVLAGRERALVDAAPGTTRDFVEIALTWDGVSVTLVDTAGDRDAGDAVEQRGIAMGAQRAKEADLCIRVHSAEDPASLDAAMRPSGDEGRRILAIITKGDLLADDARRTLEERSDRVITSAKSGEGVERLRRRVLDRVFGHTPREAEDGLLVTNERQRMLLEQAAAALDRAAQGMRAGAPIEVPALEVREGTERLAEIMGERVGDEMLDDLFRRFCIGK